MAPFQALNQQKADCLEDYSQVDGNRLSITFGSDQRSCAIIESSFIAVKSLDVAQSVWRLENNMTYLCGVLAAVSEWSSAFQ